MYQVGTESIPVVLWEEGNMIEIHALSALQIYAHQTLGVCLWRGKCGGIFLPLVVGDGNALLGNYVIV